MKIHNFSRLAQNNLRRHGLEILNAGLEEIDTPSLMANKSRLHGQIWHIGSHEFDLSQIRQLIVIGFGKVAPAVAASLFQDLGPRIDSGVVLGLADHQFGPIRCLATTHPYPSQANQTATLELEKSVTDLTSRDLVIVIVAGGGSAMLCHPVPGVSVQSLAQLNRQLIEKGASIQDINTVRKHLSLVKGGHLARLLAPARFHGLVFSDVDGDKLDIIASGPLALDSTSIDTAIQILKRYHIPGLTTWSSKMVETPKDIGPGAEHMEVLVNYHLALQAMADKAQALGYRVKKFPRYLSGQAKQAGRAVLELAEPGVAVLAAGETTVTVTGPGQGGRNQELVLGSLDHLKPGQLLISCASDGRDMTAFAGALADTHTVGKAQQLGLSPRTFLHTNNSSEFFQAVDDAIVTNELESNVADLILALAAKL